jgi:signal transduction histidine kinase
MTEHSASPELRHVLEQCSREFAVVVGVVGVVRWADIPARQLGVAPPGRLADAVVPGCEDKAAELVALNRQLARQKLRLEESSTAIRALHGELAEQADRMRPAAEVKARLVAGVSAEFRTPLHSILGLSRLLLAAADGPLTAEQETQVRFIRDSAEELSRMINDMLDLARLDAGGAPILRNLISNAQERRKP